MNFNVNSAVSQSFKGYDTIPLYVYCIVYSTGILSTPVYST